MSKGDKQHGNREAKKPKADKKVIPPPTLPSRPAADPKKPSRPAGK